MYPSNPYGDFQALSRHFSALTKHVFAKQYDGFQHARCCDNLARGPTLKDEARMLTNPYIL